MKVAAVALVTCLLIVSSFYLLAEGGVSAGDPNGAEEWTGLDTLEMLKGFKESGFRNGEKVSRSTAEFETFSYDDGPYPLFKDDGLLFGREPPLKNWGDNYVSEVMYRPPNNPGGGFSQDATGGAGNFGVGDTHESFIGDQNRNGVLEWISFFSYKPWGEDGLDNDGDGCIDEKTYGDWDGQVGCDNVPDQIVYFGTGGLPDVGGKDGTLAIFVEWYSGPPTTNLYRIFVTPRWTSHSLRLGIFPARIADNEDFISFVAHESDTGVNANPELDNELDDYYVGNIDARGFPSVLPTAHACFASYWFSIGTTVVRDDGYAVSAFELWELQDGRDWNGDGDTDDVVLAYYVVDPATGKCDQGVNGGVYGVYPRIGGRVMTPGYTRESSDDRDWNGDGDKFDTVLLWHDIDSTWSLVGHRYTSFTFTSKPGPFGFGFWGRYSDFGQFQTYPLKFGGTFYQNLGFSQGYYHTYFWLVDDEDGDPQTILPKYHAGYGSPGGTLSGVCIHIYAREYHLGSAGVKLIGGIADGNGDGDTSDTLNAIFCPNEKGGDGKSWLEPSSKFVRGLYQDGQPWIWAGYHYYASGGESDGLVIIPFFYHEMGIGDDANGNLRIESVWYQAFYWMTLDETELSIVETEWVGDYEVQPGGTVIGRISILNSGKTRLSVAEDASLINVGANYRAQALYIEESGNNDRILEPGEVVSIYFALTLSAGAPIGFLTVTFYVGPGFTVVEAHMMLP
ncbi:MAG: hypothetical protein KAW09_11780, partial [Thermoplasmata archaeon]|nr:hypothetical protein [Thermoplasmata archaeon]